MNIDAVNGALRRDIKSGNQYEKYFPKAECKAASLGSGDTTFTLELMKQWVQKYQYQTSKIAPILKGRSIPATVQNIYNFLFHHLQYAADGYEQNLRSPACSWASRKQGIDCKSYSLFAGSVLSKLKIPFKFRKITQPQSPDVWSHVYVIIPYQNKELIIDATKSVNEEPNKILEFDMSINLPHFGLNGESEVLTERDAKMIEAIANFKKELRFLEEKGVPAFVTERILDEVKNSIINGEDPLIKFFADKISVNGIEIPFGITIQGLGFLDPGTIGVIGSVFSSLFGGGKPLTIPEAVTISSKEHVAPMVERMNRETSSMTNLTAPSVLTSLDKYSSLYIAHTEAKRNLSNNQAATTQAKIQNEIDGHRNVLNQIRSKYADSFDLTPTRETVSDNTFLGRPMKQTIDFMKYSLKKETNYTAPTLNNIIPFNPSASNSGFDFNSLIALGNDLLQNTKTGQVYTTDQVQALQNQTIQNAQTGGNNNNSGSTDYTKPLLIGLGVLTVAGGIYLAKQKNII